MKLHTSWFSLTLSACYYKPIHYKPFVRNISFTNLFIRDHSTCTIESIVTRPFNMFIHSCQLWNAKHICALTFGTNHNKKFFRPYKPGYDSSTSYLDMLLFKQNYKQNHNSILQNTKHSISIFTWFQTSINKTNHSCQPKT